MTAQHLLPVLRADQLQAIEPEQRWLIEELWSFGAVGIIGGEPKCCKSFLALGMAVALASGQPCLGRFAVPRPGRVLLYAAEDAPHIVRERLDGICAWHGVDLETLDLWVITAPSLRLDHDQDCQQLAATVERLQPALLVLDPFVRLHRVDENQSAAIAPLLASLRTLQRQFGCAIAVVHHARKGAHKGRAGQGLRGSSEFHAWGDSNLYLHRRADSLAMRIEHRACPSPDEALPLRLDTQDDAVALVASTPHHEPPAPPDQPTASPRDRIIEVLQAASEPVRQRQLRQRCRIRGQTLTATLRQLVDAGEVHRDDRGWFLPTEPSTPHTQLPLLPLPEPATP